MKNYFVSHFYGQDLTKLPKIWDRGENDYQNLKVIMEYKLLISLVMTILGVSKKYELPCLCQYVEGCMSFG